tara:strand:+ start:161 stop:556 length:396 start_codon:yes stop_codon:yes gene_type:complete
MTKTLTQIKEDVAEYGDNFVEEVAAFSYFPVKAKWDAMVAAVRSIETWSDKVTLDADFQLICSAEENAADSTDSQIELFVEGEATGIIQHPDHNEENTAYYQMCILSMNGLIEDIASEDYDFYETLRAAIA